MDANDILPQALPVRQESSDTCYFPDKAVAKGYKACGSNSICCDLDGGDECLHIGLCGRYDRNGTQTLYQGACTNQDWTFCTSICKAKINETAPVKRCGSDDYCCEDPPNDCCDSAADRITIVTLPDSNPPGPVGSLRPDPPQRPVGAIIGGVVGGLAFITILSIIGCCFFRRRRAAKRKLLKDEREDKDKTSLDPTLAEADAGPGTVLVELDARIKAMAEADAGPNSVLVESDARPIKPKNIHELPA